MPSSFWKFSISEFRIVKIISSPTCKSSKNILTTFCVSKLQYIIGILEQSIRQASPKTPSSPLSFVVMILFVSSISVIIALMPKVRGSFVCCPEHAIKVNAQMNTHNVIITFFIKKPPDPNFADSYSSTGSPYRKHLSGLPQPVKGFLTTLWTGKQAPPPLLSSPVFAEILRVFRRKNCRETSYSSPFLRLSSSATAAAMMPAAPSVPNSPVSTISE